VIRRASGVSVCVIQVIALAVAHRAHAQGTSIQPPTRPFSGMFNATRPQPNSRESLSLTVTGSESFDSDMVGSAEASAGAVPAESGVYSRASSQLDYSRLFRRAEFSANGGATLDFYPALGAEISQPVDSYTGNASLGIRLGRATVQVSQAIGYQPFFGFQPIPGAPSGAVTESPDTATQTDPALFDEPSITHATSAGLSVPIDRRSTVTAGYSHSGSTHSTFWPSIVNQGINVAGGRNVTRNLQINTQYSYQFSTYESESTPQTEFTSHQLSAGFTYTRPLSRTRTVTASMGLGGTTTSDDPLSQAAGTKNVSARGGVGFQFARSWSVHADYSRSLQILQGLLQPYYGDSLSFGLGGQPTRRLAFSVDGTLMKGDPTRKDANAAFDSGNVVANSQYALSRNLAVSATYVRSQYNFGSGAELPAGVQPKLARNVFSLGLTFGTMLLGR
jgi:hypothetical protein